METKEILKNTREIWGSEKLELSKVIIIIGKVFGDICRWERNYAKDANTHTDNDLKKELGNLIVCGIKFSEQLGYDPEECIRLALESQRRISKEI
jgi:hypothetical protein